MDINSVLSGFLVGYTACIFTVLIGCLIEALSLRKMRARNRRYKLWLNRRNNIVKFRPKEDELNGKEKSKRSYNNIMGRSR